MATSDEDVKVIEVCRVNPRARENLSDSNSNTVANNYLPLTFFDTIWIRSPPTQRIFFYQINNLTSHLFYNTILPRLKYSLSLTLQHYPPLAGHLIWHPETARPSIRYSPEDSVFLSVAESTGDFDSLSTHDLKEAKHLHTLLPDLHFSQTEAQLLSLQLTLFPGYGFSIGYSAHHVSMDGKSTAMFFKSWAKICKDGDGDGVLPLELIPVFDRSLIDDPLDICTIFIDDWSKMVDNKRSLVPMELKPSPGLFRRTFRLTREQIGQIKGRINIKSSPVSSFTAVCSYIWTCLVKTEDITGEDVYLGISVDCRARMEPQIPENYFGNCVKGQLAKAKVVSLEGGDGMAAAATGIREAIEKLSEGVLKGAERWVSNVGAVSMNEKMYGIAGSPWFELYGVDFGWGRPKKVEMVSIDRNGSFSLCDSRDGNGVIEIGIVLSKVKIQAFASIFAQGLIQ